MRILILTTFFPPQNSIASLRPYSWAKYWALAGHDVTVITMQKPADTSTDMQLPNPGFHLIEVPPAAFFNKLKKEYRETKERAGIGAFFKKKIVNLYQYLRFKRGVFNACRMPDFADFWIGRAHQAACQASSQTGKPWDLVVSSAGPYAVHIIAQRLKKSKTALRWVADYRDNWSSNHIYPGLFPFTVIEKFLERRLMRSADLITATSAPFAAKMAASYGQTARIDVIENGFDPTIFATLPALPYFPEDGKFRIVYTGTIYPGKQDATPFFQALAEIVQDPLQKSLCDNLEIIFAGHQLDPIRDLVQRFGLHSYVRVLGFISREDALRMQREAHYLLFIVWKDLAERGVFSGKIYEYLFSGSSIMAIGAEGMEESQALIIESRTGVALQSSRAIKDFLIEKLKKGVKEKNSPDRAVLARYDRRFLAEKLLQHVS